MKTNVEEDEEIREYYRHSVAPKLNPIANLRLDVQGLIWEVLDRYDLTWAQMVSRNRKQFVADCRHLIMALLAWHSPMSLVEIGILFGSRDHGTVIHGRNKVAKMYDTDAKVVAVVNDLERRHFFIENHEAVVRNSAPKAETGFILPLHVRRERNAVKKRKGPCFNSGTLRGSA